MILQLIETPRIESRDWAAELEDERVWVRRRAAGLLSTAVEQSRGAVEALTGALGDADPAVRKLAAQALAGVGTEALERLLPVLRHPRPTARAYAAQILGALGPAGSAAAPELRMVLQDPDLSVRCSAAAALGAIGSGAAQGAEQSQTPASVTTKCMGTSQGWTGTSGTS